MGLLVEVLEELDASLEVVQVELALARLGLLRRTADPVLDDREVRPLTQLANALVGEHAYLVGVFQIVVELHILLHKLLVL